MFFSPLSRDSLVVTQDVQLCGGVCCRGQAGGLEQWRHRLLRLAAGIGAGAQVVNQAGGLEAVEPIVKGLAAGLQLGMIGCQLIPDGNEILPFKKLRYRHIQLPGLLQKASAIGFQVAFDQLQPAA